MCQLQTLESQGTGLARIAERMVSGSEAQHRVTLYTTAGRFQAQVASTSIMVNGSERWAEQR